MKNLKLFFLSALMLLNAGMMWGNTASKDGSAWESNRTWSGNHASFSLDGSGYNSTLKGASVSSGNHTISWTANDGCTMTVTKVSVKAGSSKICDLSVNGQDQVSLFWQTNTSTASNLSITGKNGSIKFNTTNDACVYTITVTYTITPNAPGLTATTATTTVYENVPLTNYFTTSDHYGESWNYTFTSNPGSAASIEDNKFSATAAGTYKLTANIAAVSGCHEASAQSPELTITVDRLASSLVYNDGVVSAYTEAKQNTLDLSTLKSESSVGNGDITYAVKSATDGGVVADAHIDGSTFYATKDGLYTLTASMAQTGQYEAGSVDFTVKVNNLDFMITWLDENDSVLNVDTLPYDSMPSHADLTKEATAQYTFTFKGWTPEIVPVTEDATYKSLGFDTIINKYSITWLDENDSVLNVDTLTYSATPTHAPLTKEATAQYTFTFKGWTPEIVAVTADATYKSLGFDTIINTYSVTWLDENDSVLGVDTLIYSETPSHAALTKEATAQYTYTWNGWDKEIVPVTEDATYKSLGFTAAAIEYHITYTDSLGVENPNPTSYTCETETFVLDTLSLDGYTFLGWFDATGNKVTQIEKGTTGDIDLTAGWQKKEVTPEPTPDPEPDPEPTPDPDPEPEPEPDPEPTPDPTPSAVNEIHAATMTKILVNGHILIIRDGRIYDLSGHLVK